MTEICYRIGACRGWFRLHFLAVYPACRDLPGREGAPKAQFGPRQRGGAKRLNSGEGAEESARQKTGSKLMAEPWATNAARPCRPSQIGEGAPTTKEPPRRATREGRTSVWRPGKTERPVAHPARRSKFPWPSAIASRSPTLEPTPARLRERPPNAYVGETSRPRKALARAT